MIRAPAVRGYRPLYRPGTACPGCGASHWTIGRFSAECAVCATALPFAPAVRETAPPERLPRWATRP